jgi:hypothetical protein
MRLTSLFCLALACGHATQEGPVNPQIQDQIAALDRDPDGLHADRTPAVTRLIELGEPALVPLYDHLDHPDHLHRQRAQRAIEGITRRSFGFDGRAWPAGTLQKWTTWWTGIAYDAEAAPAERAAGIARLRQWSRARAAGGS